MDAMKEESVPWTRSSTWFALLIESFIFSMVLFIWSISLSKCGTLRVIVPLDWSPLALFSAFSFSKFWPHSPPCRCWRCLLTSLVNSWFYCISSSIAVAMDYNLSLSLFFFFSPSYACSILLFLFSSPSYSYKNKRKIPLISMILSKEKKKTH